MASSIRRAAARHGNRPHGESAAYWDERYRAGRSSGAGSYGRLAEFKADVLNGLVVEHDVRSVIELGCGDGNQLRLANYPNYLGLDVSPTAVETCRARFIDDPTKSFALLSNRESWTMTQADMTLSLDVVYHLVEDVVFDDHMALLFDLARHFVVIYSSNVDQPGSAPHVRHRRFTDWIDLHVAGWERFDHVPNPYPARPGEEDGEHSFCEFWVYGG